MAQEQRPLLTIQFGKSPSHSYDEAVAIATRFRHDLVGTGRSAKVRILIMRRGEILEIPRLLLLIRNWRSTEVLRRGVECRISDLLRLIECAKFARADLHPEYWCYGKQSDKQHPIYTLGCRYIPITEGLGSGPHWWEFGEMIDESSFRVDKKKLLAVAIRALHVGGMGLCPFFTLRRIRDAVAALPDEIDPTRDRSWTYCNTWRDGRAFRTCVKKAGQGSWIGLSIPEILDAYKPKEGFEVPGVPPSGPVAGGAYPGPKDIDDLIDRTKRDAQPPDGEEPTTED